MDMFKEASIIEMFKSSDRRMDDFSCKNGHMTCYYCGYLSSNHPSFYSDLTGRTYLSSEVL